LVGWRQIYTITPAMLKAGGDVYLDVMGCMTRDAVARTIAFTSNFDQPVSVKGIGFEDTFLNPSGGYAFGENCNINLTLNPPVGYAVYTSESWTPLYAHVDSIQLDVACTTLPASGEMKVFLSEMFRG